MRVVGRTGRAAAVAIITALAGACVVPPPGIAPRPDEQSASAPEVSFYSFDSAPYGAGTGTLSYSVTRDAYAAVFEVDRRGYVRVLPSGNARDAGTVDAGRSYVVYPQLHSTDREVANAQGDYARLPFVFVVTADEPLDLSMFGSEGRWSRAIRVDAGDPDSTVASVARVVARDAPAYGADFAYVGPQLYSAERQFVSQCQRPVEDLHDYQYFRELWAVFTPYDPLLGATPVFGFAPTFGWASSYGAYAFLPLAASRAQLATTAFYGFCDPGSSYTWQLASGFRPYGGYYGSYGGYYPAYAGLGWYATPWAYGVARRAIPYGPGTIAALPTSGPMTAPIPLRIPRTPLALGTMQVDGGPDAGSPSRTGATAFRRFPGAERLGWQLGPSARRPDGAAMAGVGRAFGLGRPIGATEGRGSQATGWSHHWGAEPSARGTGVQAAASNGGWLARVHETARAGRSDMGGGSMTHVVGSSAGASTFSGAASHATGGGAAAAVGARTEAKSGGSSPQKQ